MPKQILLINNAKLLANHLPAKQNYYKFIIDNNYRLHYYLRHSTSVNEY